MTDAEIKKAIEQLAPLRPIIVADSRMILNYQKMPIIVADSHMTLHHQDILINGASPTRTCWSPLPSLNRPKDK